MLKQDNNKPRFTRGAKILLTARRWARHWNRWSPKQRATRVLVAIVLICSAVAAPLLSHSLWLTVSVVIVGVCAMAALVWLLRPPRAPEAAKATRQLLSRRQMLATAAIILLIGFPVSWWYRKKQLEASYFRNRLKSFGLPPELYDHQSHLETLIIDQSLAPKPRLGDINWLNSGELKNLTVAGASLTSLEGLAHVTGLQSIEIDLADASLGSLHALTCERGLRTLTLRNIGPAKRPLVPELNAFPELTDLDLDFRYSPISLVPDFTACSQLKHVALDLRSTAKISALPDFSQLTNLQTVTLWLDTSAVTSVKPLLGRLAALQTLTLSVDGTQLHLLSELNDSSGPETLDISLTSPPNSSFPELSGMTGMTTLNIHMPGQRGDNLPDNTPVPDITRLKQLKGLAIFLNGSDVSALPPIGNLSELLKLSLNLRGSRLATLPDISSLGGLQRLSINLSSSRITELPHLTSFSNLLELHLLLESLPNTGVYSLRELASLSKLENLELDISDTTISDLLSIVKLEKLTTLSLRLRWEQVSDLPELLQLKNLCTLELHLHGGWIPQKLPRLDGLQALRVLVLDIENAHITRLPDVPNLTTLTLQLANSDVEDLSVLENLTDLKELVLNASGTHLHNLPQLKSLQHLQRVIANIKHSEVPLRELDNLMKLQELTIAGNVESLQDLPVSVKRLVFDAGKGIQMNP